MGRAVTLSGKQVGKKITNSVIKKNGPNRAERRAANKKGHSGSKKDKNKSKASATKKKSSRAKSSSSKSTGVSANNGKKIDEKFITKTNWTESKVGWNMNPHGSVINGREYSGHALERMAPNTPEVQAELHKRAAKGTVNYRTKDVEVIINEQSGKVVTVIPKRGK